MPPFPTSPRAASNCGFTRRTASPPGARSGTAAGRISARRDERDVRDEEGDRLRHLGGREGARVHLLAEDDARVPPQLRVELAVPDVDRVDLRRAAREKDVGEAPRRGSDVEADLPPGVDPERLERRRELDAAAETQGNSGSDTATSASGGTAVPGFTVSCPVTRTRPARISASARVRDSARPRSTRSRSSRSRPGFAVTA